MIARLSHAARKQPGQTVLLLALCGLAVFLLGAGVPRLTPPAKVVASLPAPAPLSVPRFVSQAALVAALDAAAPVASKEPPAPSPFGLSAGGWERLRAARGDEMDAAWLRAQARRHQLTSIWLGGTEPEAAIDGALVRVGASVGIFTLAAIEADGVTLELEGTRVPLELTP